MLKYVLRGLGLYHGLQRLYRGAINRAVRARHRISYRRYRGQGFVCNCCGSRYQRFVPNYPKGNVAVSIIKHQVVAGYGDNVFCPHCMSKNRERLVVAVLADLINVEGKSVLHFSPEPNVYRFLSTRATVTTVDLSPGFYRHIDSSVGFADATKLPFEDESFDLVIANHILEHIPEDEVAMGEILRVLKKGGTAMLQVPYSMALAQTIEDKSINDPEQQELLYGQKDHVRVYALKDYIRRLEQCGYQVELLADEQLAPFQVHAIQKDECVILAHRRC